MKPYLIVLLALSGCYIWESSSEQDLEIVENNQLKKVEKLFGDRPIHQNSAWETTYHVSENNYVMTSKDGATRVIEGIDTTTHHVRQSGPFLISMLSLGPNDSRPTYARIFREGEFHIEIPYPQIIAYAADYMPDRLFLAGYSMDRTEIVMMCVNDQGEVLKTETMPFKDVTLWPKNAFRTKSLIDDRQSRWLVWFPERLELLVFDLDMELVNLVEVQVPKDILDVFNIFSFFDDPEMPDLKAKCEAHIGRIVAPLPFGFFKLKDELVIGYQTAALKSCGSGEISPHTLAFSAYSDLLYLSSDTYVLTRREKTHNIYINGLYGSQHLLCGKEMDDDKYPYRVWTW